jgi:hypothetical protein
VREYTDNAYAQAAAVSNGGAVAAADAAAATADAGTAEEKDERAGEPGKAMAEEAEDVSGDVEDEGGMVDFAPCLPPSTAGEGGLTKDDAIDELRVWWWHRRFMFTEHYTLKWESAMLTKLADALMEVVFNSTQGAVRDLAAYTSMAAVAAALTWPLYVVKALDALDPTWTMACERADLAGKLLAETLLTRPHGSRPISLVGFSMGARLIFSCLLELERVHSEFEKAREEALKTEKDRAEELQQRRASRNPFVKMGWQKPDMGPKETHGASQFSMLGDDEQGNPLTSDKDLLEASSPVAGLIESVVLMGVPITCNMGWDKARRVVAGRLVNCYSDRDWTLALLYRQQRWSLHVAGIRPVDTPGVEDLNVSHLISGHNKYVGITFPNQIS